MAILKSSIANISHFWQEHYLKFRDKVTEVLERSNDTYTPLNSFIRTELLRINDIDSSDIFSEGVTVQIFRSLALGDTSLSIQKSEFPLCWLFMVCN
jgi:hypothetical protein